MDSNEVSCVSLGSTFNSEFKALIRASANYRRLERDVKPDYFNCIMITGFTLLLMTPPIITIVYIITNHLI